MSDKLNNYPGLKALVEATESSTRALLSISLLQAFLDQLSVRGISLDRKGRMELVRLSVWPSYRESGAKAVLRSELIGEFEKMGLSTEDSFRVAEMFLETAEKGELK